MKTILKMAWRNVWRNRRRTLITSASILFAVFFSTFMVALQAGGWDKLLDNVVNFYFGYAQVQPKGYQNDQSIDLAYPFDDKIRSLPDQDPAIQLVVPRLESFALASYGEKSAGVLVIGTDPEAENRMTGLSDRLTQGRYLDPAQPGILIGEGVAENLKLGVGDTLVLLSQGYHGANAAGKYPVAGLVKFASPELNKQMVYLSLPDAQALFDAPGLVTSSVLKIRDKEAVDEAVAAAEAALGTESYDVLDWKELVPDLVEAREFDAAGNYVMLFILYAIITFGIFGTILMMTRERQYEFGVLVAIGMNRWKLGLMVWLEIVFLGLIGALAGILVSVPMVYYFHINPLDLASMSEDMGAVYEKWGFEPTFPAAFRTSIFTTQALIVVVITTVLSFYPFSKIIRLKPVEAMRG